MDFKPGLTSCLFFYNPSFPNLFSFTAPFSEAKLSGTVFFWNAHWGIQVKWSESRSVMSNSLQPHGLCGAWNSPGQNTEEGSLSLLQGIFPTQESNPGLPHCRWILYKLSHQGSPRIQGVGSLSHLQGILPTQELNRGLLPCRRILYQLSYQGCLVKCWLEN